MQCEKLKTKKASYIVPIQDLYTNYIVVDVM